MKSYYFAYVSKSVSGLQTYTGFHISGISLTSLQATLPAKSFTIQRELGRLCSMNVVLDIFNNSLMFKINV